MRRRGRYEWDYSLCVCVWGGSPRDVTTPGNDVVALDETSQNIEHILQVQVHSESLSVTLRPLRKEKNEKKVNHKMSIVCACMCERASCVCAQAWLVMATGELRGLQPFSMQTQTRTICAAGRPPRATPAHAHKTHPHTLHMISAAAAPHLST